MRRNNRWLVLRRRFCTQWLCIMLWRCCYVKQRMMWLAALIASLLGGTIFRKCPDDRQVKHRVFPLIMAIFHSWDMAQNSLHLCNWCYPLHTTQLSWTSATYNLAKVFGSRLLVLCFWSSLHAMFLMLGLIDQAIPTEQYMVALFVFLTIYDFATQTSMTGLVLIQSSFNSALMCCFTKSSNWHSSWPLLFLNEGASKMV